MSRNDEDNNQEKKKKVFHIGEFKHKVVIDPNYADKTWKILESAILEIYNRNERNLSFTELNRNAYYMVLHKFGDKLYTGLVDTLTHHLKLMSTSIEASHGRLFLEEINNKWTDHNDALKIICEIFLCIDRIYIPRTRKASVHELGLNLWRDKVVNSSTIQTRLLETILEQICMERKGEVINRGLIKYVIKMLTDLGPSVYEENFEKHFLDFSAEFYRAESEEFLECCDCGAYLKNAEQRLNEELKRVSNYLDSSSEVKIINVVENEMIGKHIARLVHMKNSGLVNMLVYDKYEDMGRMYNLFGRFYNGLSTISEVFISHLRDTMKQIVTNPEMSEKLKVPVKFVKCLLNEKDKYDKIINSAFNNDQIFQKALNSSFEDFVNLNPRSAEFISLFVDDKMRKGLKKGVSKEALEIVLVKVVNLFRYLKEKDVFEEYYNQHLAKRLLSGKMVTEDSERSLVMKLETECGSQFTSKLEGMLKDMKTCKDTFQSDLGGGPTLVVQVLTKWYWPPQPSVTCNLPAELSPLCKKYKSYYLGANKRRRLTWQANLGTADVKATFKNGQKHELNVSTYQMCVLMLFNDSDQLSYNEIEQATEIPPLDLKRCLQSLALVKGKNVLKKVPMSKDIGEDDAFSVNENFRSKFFKVKIGTVCAQKESESEKQEMREKIEEARKPHIEAAIVRIMKSRKDLDHNALIAEVSKQLQTRFLVNTEEIKKVIESLIEREYLSRLDSSLYRYLA